jgi:hypothetical protein
MSVELQTAWANYCVERMRVSRSAQLAFAARWRLARTAHANRSAIEAYPR